jgi:putative flippase GtrA
MAYAASFIAGNTAGYLLNARFTFSVGTVSHAGAIRYMAVNGVLLCLSTAFMRLMVGEFHVWYIGAALLVAALNTPLSFLAQRFVTYRMRAMDSAPNR